jgi:phosphoribosyl-ATP pyrophosphohydrolase
MSSNSLVAAWFRDEDKKLLVKVCENRRETITDFVRRSVMSELARLSYLPAEEKKALGIIAK